MKTNKALKIALATVCGAAIMSVGSAFCAEDTKETYYPQDFDRTLTFEEGTHIRDFAVYGDTLAFAYSNHVYILYTDDGGERQLQKPVYDHTSGVTAIDFDDEGNLYFKDATEVTYLYSSSRPEQIDDHEFQSITAYKLEVSADVTYMLDRSDGTLQYWNAGYPATVNREGEENDKDFSLLKTYGGKVYAVKDNVPYVLDGSTAKPQDDLKYTDFDGAKGLYTGAAKRQLQKLNESVVTYEIKEGTFYTEIPKGELGDNLEGNAATRRAKSNITCLLLCESGNASIVASGNDYFITATENLINPSTIQSTSDGKNYYTVSEASVYSTPFMSESSVLTGESGEKVSLTAGQVVTVIERYEHSVLNSNFCKIRFEENGKTVTGFVSANFLSPYTFAAEDNEQTNGGDKEPSYDTNVASVILAIVIVALVIIAILYISMISSKKDKNKKEKKKQKKEKPRQVPEDDEDADNFE